MNNPIFRVLRVRRTRVSHGSKSSLWSAAKAERLISARSILVFVSDPIVKNTNEPAPPLTTTSPGTARNSKQEAVFRLFVYRDLFVANLDLFFVYDSFHCRLPVVGPDTTRQGETTLDIYPLLQLKIPLLYRRLEGSQLIKIAPNCPNQTYFHNIRNKIFSFSVKLSG